MAAIYEFHVSGLVGSVIRSALPEMQTFEQTSGRTMRGIADERREIDRLLELIQTMNLVVHRLQICVRSEGRPHPSGCRSIRPDPASSELGGDVPVVDDRGAQGNILE